MYNYHINAQLYLYIFDRKQALFKHRIPNLSLFVTFLYNKSNIENQFKDGCSDGEFRCFDGECIPSSYLCDGYLDCYGFAEDEWGCGMHYVFFQTYIIVPYCHI